MDKIKSNLPKLVGIILGFIVWLVTSAPQGARPKWNLIILVIFSICVIYVIVNLILSKKNK